MCASGISVNSLKFLKQSVSNISGGETGFFIRYLCCFGSVSMPVTRELHTQITHTEVDGFNCCRFLSIELSLSLSVCVV